MPTIMHMEQLNVGCMVTLISPKVEHLHKVMTFGLIFDIGQPYSLLDCAVMQSEDHQTSKYASQVTYLSFPSYGSELNTQLRESFLPDEN